MTRLVVAATIVLGLLGGAAPPATASDPDRPSAPQDMQASPGSESAVVSWEEPASTNPLTYYWVEAYRDGRRIDGRRMSAPATALRFDGLKNGVAYTFTVYATNISGDGPLSVHSRPVTPSADKPSGPPGTLAARPPEHRRATTTVAPKRRPTTTTRRKAVKKRSRRATTTVRR